MTDNKTAGAVRSCPGREDEDLMTTTDQPTPAEYNAKIRATIAQARENGDPGFADEIIDWHLDYADEHGLYLGGREVDLWGFGKAHIMFNEPDGGWWIGLYSLIEPTGLSPLKLRDLFEEDEADAERGAISVARVPYGDERDPGLPIVHHDFVMRAFALHSPWRKEFYENTEELMRHAMINSGLADLLTGLSTSGYTAVAEMHTVEGEPFRLHMPVKAFDPHDNVPLVSSPFDDAAEGEQVRITDLTETYTIWRASDVTQDFLGPTVSEDEAIARALRGPSGPLDD